MFKRLNISQKRIKMCIRALFLSVSIAFLTMAPLFLITSFVCLFNVLEKWLDKKGFMV